MGQLSQEGWSLGFKAHPRSCLQHTPDSLWLPWASPADRASQAALSVTRSPSASRLSGMAAASRLGYRCGSGPVSSYKTSGVVSASPWELAFGAFPLQCGIRVTPDSYNFSLEGSCSPPLPLRRGAGEHMNPCLQTGPSALICTASNLRVARWNSQLLFGNVQISTS